MNTEDMNDLKYFVVKFNNLVFGKLIQKIGLRGFFSKISLPEEPTLLEIGCKDGYALRIIHDFFSPKMLIGIDIDKGAIQKAKKGVMKNGLDNVAVYVADTQKLSFKDETFDAVFMFATLHHVPNWQRALQEIRRVLKEGGFFVFKEPLAKFYNLPFAKYFDQPSSLFSEKVLKEELRRNDFKISHWTSRGFYKIFFNASVEVICKKM